MIRFIQDYTTKALPPETFKADQEVERSAESEAYFVRLGAAGYVHDGVLVDQDYKPIVLRTAVVEVVSGDRRFADGGRGGEVIGVTAPQRASTGPGNDVMFGRTDLFGEADPELHRVQMEQLSSDLAASMRQLDDHRTQASTRVDELTADLTAAQGAREEALSSLSSTQAERDEAKTSLADLNATHAALQTDHETLQADHEAAQSRIADLEQQIAAAARTASEEQSETTAKPAGRGK